MVEMQLFGGGAWRNRVMVGRKRKPTAVKELQGSRDRHSEQGKEYVDALPVSPLDEINLDLLCDKGKANFIEIYNKLTRSKVLSDTDIEMLKILADAFAQFWDAHAEIQLEGYTFIGSKGVPVKNPYITIKAQAFDRIKSLMGEFGLTPSSRTKIEKVCTDDDNDSLAQILNFGR